MQINSNFSDEFIQDVIEAQESAVLEAFRTSVGRLPKPDVPPLRSAADFDRYGFGPIPA